MPKYTIDIEKLPEIKRQVIKDKISKHSIKLKKDKKDKIK